jgi:DNA-binding IclR family transcriptional regulator
MSLKQDGHAPKHQRARSKMTKQRHRSPRPDRQLAAAVKASKAPAIARAAAILRLLGKSDTPLGVHSIARELGLVPSTCLHVLRALVAEEFVSFDSDTKRYALEAGVLMLARHWLRRNRFNDLAQPALDRIAQTFDVTVLGVQVVGLDHIVVVAVSQSGHNFQLSTQIGSRFPALISATGRCIAAFGGHSEAELEARFRTLRWDEPPTLDEWKAQVSQTRSQGFAVDAGNYISGVTLIAAPVWKTRMKLSHALVALGISSTLRRAGLPALQDILLSAAQTLSNQLCGEGSSEWSREL